MTNPNIGGDLERALEILRNGGLIGLPTETVYGLAGDASQKETVQKIFQVKDRPITHPLIVHIGHVQNALEWCSDWTASARALSQAFWPGPLTLVVDKSAKVLDILTAGHNTVALRVPAHQMALELLEKFGGGLAAPSANKFGKVSPTTAQHVYADLGGQVDYVLDGGPCGVGLESTIVDCAVSPPQILRPGHIDITEIENIVQRVAKLSGPSRAPGMMKSHYAPRCRVLTVEDISEVQKIMITLEPTDALRILQAQVDPQIFAHDMYALLRQCDEDQIDVAIIVLPADRGIGSAIRDRLSKASTV